MKLNQSCQTQRRKVIIVGIRGHKNGNGAGNGKNIVPNGDSASIFALEFQILCNGLLNC